MSEIMVAPLASVVLGLVLAYDGYNKSKSNTNTVVANGYLYTGVALLVFAAVAVVAMLIKPTSPGVKTILSVIGLIALLVALVAAWLNYVNTSGTPLAAEALVLAIVVSIPILSTLLTREDVIRLKLN
jgi:hypothetical protein